MNSVNRKKIIVGLLISIAIIIVILIYMNAPTQRLRKHLSLGDKYLSELKYEDAILAYEAAIAIEPRNEAAYIGLVNAYIGLKDYEQALDAVQRGIAAVGETDVLKKLREELEAKLKAKENEITDGFDEEYDEEVLEQYEYLAPLSREAFAYLTNPLAEMARPDMLYITYDEAKSSYGELIEGLEDYIVALENSSANGLKGEKYENIMSVQAVNLTVTGDYNGVQLLTMSSAYNLLIKCYLRIGDMENALRVRRLLAEFMGEKRILGNHAFSYPNSDVTYTLDEYGREIALDMDNRHEEKVYGDGSAIGASHEESKSDYDGVTYESTCDYTYENGRVAREESTSHNTSHNSRVSSSDITSYIEYGYGEKSVSCKQHTVDLKNNTSNDSEWTFSIDKYGEVN